MKRIFAVLLTFAITTISTTAIALPEGAIARLGKGKISSGDRAVQFSPDGTLLAVATSIGVYLYDAQTYEEVALLETTAYMYSVAFNHDGTLLASGSGWPENEVKLWNPSTPPRQLLSKISFLTIRLPGVVELAVLGVHHLLLPITLLLTTQRLPTPVAVEFLAIGTLRRLLAIIPSVITQQPWPEEFTATSLRRPSSIIRFLTTW